MAASQNLGSGQAWHGPCRRSAEADPAVPLDPGALHRGHLQCGLRSSSPLFLSEEGLRLAVGAGACQASPCPQGSYIASDMEEDNPTSKQSIFQFLLGREHWPDLYKEFLKLKVEFFRAMGHRAWVTPELCEEIQAQNPHHWVWSREHQCAP
ncbi:uncharacterized protein LOC115290093 isoform X3 [Suricata suricatta]|uniref:uncharacterized protein LOC115290093 isoform X3 n=1 Tax=Suricata suricatta TaxID=37032 RepID=UPI0011557E8C|nr:uncharacterized protein LOC115290093 isoform X3 [Suricata suricatta]